MEVSDKTQIYAAKPIIVRIERGHVQRSKSRFVHNFMMGRGEDCDIQFSEPQVSTKHAEVVWENSQWWVKDLGSKNGTYLNGSRITELALPPQARVELALNGPVIALEIEDPTDKTVPLEKAREPGVTQIARRYFSNDNSADVGHRTMLFRQAYQKVRKKESKRYWIIIGSVLTILVLALGALYYQTQRVKKLEELHAAAENVFYTARTIDLQLAKLRTRIDMTADAETRSEFTKLLSQQYAMEATYDKFLDELGISKEKLSEEEWLIYKVARVFGECTVSMPKGFTETVKQYIRYWQSTPKFRTDIARALSRGYVEGIRDTMLANGMPPQFFYLAMRESDFETQICGPDTRSGIAKGMWQFIPATAMKYNLRTGPLVDVRRADPLDERHNFGKSTGAAARYLRDLYTSEAQASGLLVMACYNWDENKIRDMLNKMPENPRERNFWKLLGKNTIPQQTYDYVFSIVSAAVIGENPRLFGFNFDNPLQTTTIE